jgi:hypothetical protein
MVLELRATDRQTDGHDEPNRRSFTITLERALNYSGTMIPLQSISLLRH